MVDSVYNLLEIKKIEVKEVKEENICEINCVKCSEKDKIIENLQKKLKAIHDMTN